MSGRFMSGYSSPDCVSDGLAAGRLVFLKKKDAGVASAPKEFLCVCVCVCLVKRTPLHVAHIHMSPFSGVERVNTAEQQPS